MPLEILGFPESAAIAPSPLDVFLDLEGDRLAEQGGFDYLFGYALRGDTAEPRPFQMLSSQRSRVRSAPLRYAHAALRAGKRAWRSRLI